MKTLLDAQLKLLDFFSTNSAIDIECQEDLIDVVKEHEYTEEFSKDMVKAALKKYEDADMVTKINETTWVLTKPFNKYSQTIELNFPTVQAICDIFQNHAEANKIEDPNFIPDPMNINEKDITNLVLLCGILANPDENKENAD